MSCRKTAIIVLRYEEITRGRYGRGRRRPSGIARNKPARAQSTHLTPGTFSHGLRKQVQPTQEVAIHHHPPLFLLFFLSFSHHIADVRFFRFVSIFFRGYCRPSGMSHLSLFLFRPQRKFHVRNDRQKYESQNQISLDDGAISDHLTIFAPPPRPTR